MTDDELDRLVERLEALEVELEGERQRAADAEHRLYAFRQGRAARSKALTEFIKARAPDLWPDYAAVSVNGSIYSDKFTIEPTYEREMNILRARAEKAEETATTLRARIAEDQAQIVALTTYKENLRDEVVELRARIAELEARLEIDPAYPYDGIAARDATIEGLQGQIAELEAERAEWVEVERLRMGKGIVPPVTIRFSEGIVSPDHVRALRDDPAEE